MSNVVVTYGTRSTTIKVTPTTSLSSVRTGACQKLGLNPSNWSLKRNNKKVDLSLPIRFAGLPSGARLELVQSAPAPSAKPVQIVLRILDPVGELSGSFLPSSTVWDILRKLESDARAAGNAKVNITERCQPMDITSGAGRLLYEMPSVRVLNRELASFSELAETLENLGCCSGRQLLVVRFIRTDTPYEDALREVAGLSLEQAEGQSSSGVETTVKAEASAEVPAKTLVEAPTESPPSETAESNPADVEMPDLPQTPAASDDVKNNGVAADAANFATLANEPGGNILVFAPSADSATLFAATMESADSDYDIGIADLKRIKQNYHQQAQPKRLLSDKELEEKDAAEQEKIHKVETLTIKVRFPDGYVIMQNFSAKSTAADLYNSVRSVLRYADEPFTLMIPPVDHISESSDRLTLDLKLRSNTTLHMKWGNISGKARADSVLKDEYQKMARDLPKPVVPEPDKDDGGGETPRGEGNDAGKEKTAKKQESKESKEKKLKNFLRLGKK